MSLTQKQVDQLVKKIKQGKTSDIAPEQLFSLVRCLGTTVRVLSDQLRSHEIKIRIMKGADAASDAAIDAALSSLTNIAAPEANVDAGQAVKELEQLRKDIAKAGSQAKTLLAVARFSVRLVGKLILD